jgi:hypothetical protein
MKKYFIYAILLMLVFILGCSKGPYHIVHVESCLVKDNYLYVLIFREDGVDKASRFADNDYAVVQRQRLFIARVFLGDISEKFEVLATRAQPKECFDNEAGFMLMSSNSAFVGTRSGRIDMIQFGANGSDDVPTGLDAGDLFYNSDHSVLFSKPNPRKFGANQTWAVETFSLSNKTDSVSGISELVAKANWFPLYAVTPDCSQAIVQMKDGDPTNFLFCERANNYKQQKMIIPMMHYSTLEGLFNTTNGLFAVMQYFEDPTNFSHLVSVLYVCNERGFEIASTRMNHMSLFDKNLNEIIYLPEDEENRLGSISEMNIRIWSPFTGTTRNIKADLAAINRAFAER